MDYVPEEDVRKQLLTINSTYQFNLNEFIDLSFIKKVCKDRPTKTEMREGLERVFDALINHKQTLRNPPSFATQTWINALHEMREGRPFKPSPSHQTSSARPARRVFVDTPARSAPLAAVGMFPAPSAAAVEAQQIAEAQRLSLAEALHSTPAGGAGRNGTYVGEGSGCAGGNGGGRRLKADPDGWVHILGSGAARVDGPQLQQQQQQQQQSNLTSPALSTTPISTRTPSSGSGLSSPREEQNGSAAPASAPAVASIPASWAPDTSIPASWAPDLQAVHAQQHTYADLAVSGGPPVKEAMIQLAKRAGGSLMTALKAKEAWRSGVRAFAKVASEGPKDPTPAMTKVEVELARLVHEEACNAVLGVLVNGDPVQMRNYLSASRHLGIDGWPTEGARTNAKVVAQIRTLLGVAASNIGVGVDTLDVKVMQVLCQWLLDLVDDEHAQAQACAFVKARVEQAALRQAEFFGP